MRKSIIPRKTFFLHAYRAQNPKNITGALLHADPEKVLLSTRLDEITAVFLFCVFDRKTVRKRGEHEDAEYEEEVAIIIAGKIEHE